MKKLSFVLLVFIAIAGISVISSCKSSQSSAGKVLKLNLEQGKGYDYSMIMDMTQKMMGQESIIKINADFSVIVSSVEGGIRTLSSEYRRFKMDMKVMGMEMNVDTDKPLNTEDTSMASNPLGVLDKVFRGLVGKKFSVKVNESGEVLEVSGVDGLLDGIINSLGLTEEQKQMAIASAKDQFNDQTIKDQFAQMFTIFPNKEVKVGDSWEKNFSTGGKMKSEYRTKYTVKEIEGDFVTLTAKTVIKGIDPEIELSGDQGGDIIVDSKSGLMTNAELVQDMEVKAQGMTITIKGKSTIKGKAI